MKKIGNFFCAQMVDFRKPGHIYMTNHIGYVCMLRYKISKDKQLHIYIQVCYLFFKIYS